ncbi:tyrosine--tRNA ligase [bacterium]|nr:tyrosine--tRNA ligase [bacterium]
MNLIEDLKYRGLIYNVTDESVYEKLNNDKLTFYLGTDPTGDSLHVGHLLVFILAKRLEKYGHHPVLLIGGATGFIGDPKPTAERKMLTKEEIDNNAQKLYAQVKTLFNCEMVNNYDWISKLDLISFLRKYGKLFNVNYMINKETVKSRLDTGISYTEFSYQILQALDFEHLFKEKNCTLQIGGQDQWGNITSGLELIRKLNGVDAWAGGITAPLFTKSDGTKFGKTEGGAVWLDPLKTSPYSFYQFWINTPDSDVIKELKQFTFLTKEEIDELELSFNAEPEKRLAQKALAKEMTLMIHGEESLNEALKITDAVFKGDVSSLSKDEIEVAFKEDKVTIIKEDENIIDLLVETNLAPSKSEARKLIQGGGISVNNVKVTDISFVVSKENAIEKTYSFIKKGKKNHALIKHEE